MINLNTQYNLIAKNQYTATPKNTTQQRVAADTFTRTNNVSFGCSTKPALSFFSKIINSIKNFWWTKTAPKMSQEKQETLTEIEEIFANAKTNPERYEELLKNVNEILKERYMPSIENTVKDTISNALMLRDFYDKTFGKGQYSIVSIGRSPALISRVLELTGTNVKYLPISGLSSHNYPQYFENIIRKSPNYIRYVNELGLNKERVAASKKKTIFIDYTSTGTTLKRIEDMFKNIFKLPKDKIEFRSINEDLSTAIHDIKITKDEVSINQVMNLYNYIHKLMAGSGTELLSDALSLPYEEVNSIYKKQAQHQETYLGKVFDLLLNKTLKEMGLLPNSKVS